MKKMLLKATGLLTIASALLLASCSDGSTDYDGRVDTVINLKAPSVTAKAYPGVNLVSWDVVPGAEKYELYRYETGNATDKDFVKAGTNLHHYEDTDVQNNVSYTYEVMARGNVSTRKVVTFDSATGKATVTGIVPPASTSALNLAAYEGGYDGKNEKTIDDSKKISAGNIKIYNDNAKLRVVFNAKAYLEYAVASVSGNTYDVTQVESWSADKSTIVNDFDLPVIATDLVSAGTQTVWVKAVSRNSYFATPDYIKAGTVTYERLGDGVEDTGITAGYTDTAKKNIRVVFTPGYLDNGAKAGTELYKVYRKSFGTDYVAVAAPVKALSDGSYVVDDPIEDSTKGYTYAVVLTDGTKFGAKYGTKDVAAATLTPTTITTDPEGTASTLDADLLANDIKWTVTLDNVDQTFEASVLTVKKGDKLENETPKASDLDFTEGKLLKGWKVEDDTTAMKYYNYSANVPVGKTYLCVKVSEEGKESIYKIVCKTVNDATVKAPKLKVSKYDDDRDLTAAGFVKDKRDDLIITVSDSIEVASDSAANYDYVLYRTSSKVKADTTAGADGKYSITFTANIDDWVKVADVEMKSNESYNASATTVEYVGSVTSEKDMANGTYAYKVVKTNKANKVSATSAISYVNVKEVPTISYTPDITASWVSSGVDKSDVKITWEKNVQDLTEKIGTGTVLSGKTIGYTGEETDESITYTLYRATLTKNQTEVVYTAVVDEQNRLVTPGAVENKEKRDTYRDNSGTAELITPTPKYVDSITYTFTDKNVSTNASYSYIVVASKTDAENVTSDFASVIGAN